MLAKIAVVGWWIGVFEFGTHRDQVGFNLSKNGSVGFDGNMLPSLSQQVTERDEIFGLDEWFPPCNHRVLAIKT